MYTDYTWQDWQDAHMDTAAPSEKGDTIKRIIGEYTASADFQHMLDANTYFSGESPVIDKKTILRANVVTVETTDGEKRNRIDNKEIAGNRIASNFLFHFVTQQAQYLLGNGVTLHDAETKQKLGLGFDMTLQRMAQTALLHGHVYGFWNSDHLQPMNACIDRNSGFVALLDEVTSAPHVGIRFWRISDKKPMCVRLFEPDGYTDYREHDGDLMPTGEKTPYVRDVYSDAAGEMVVGSRNYDSLPIVPMYANDSAISEFSPSIKSKIDLYDRILSDFGDNLDRANDVYWVLNNFSGDVSSITQMFEYISKLKAVINQSDGMGGGSTAEPRTLEVPYQARKEALDILRKSLYSDYMALDMTEIKGGSLTNVAIKAAYSDMDLKANRFEWQVFTFVQHVMHLIGIDTEQIKFNRANITNDQEVIANIYQMRQDIDQETALRLNPYILEEQIPDILSNTDAEGQTGKNLNMLNQVIDEEDEDGDG